MHMTGTFRCAPFPCLKCSRAAMQIQLSGSAQTWAIGVQELPDSIRECVAEYLRGIYQRVRVIERAKAGRHGESK